MRIERVRLRLIRLPLVAFFETSFGRLHDRTFILVSVAGDGAEGLGECVADVDPFYSAETNVTAWHIIRDFVAPLVLGRRFDHPRDVYPALARIRGHNMAKAAVEMAMWDLAATTAGVPLSRLLGGTRRAIVSGVSIGIQDCVEQLLDKIETERAAGYRRVKIKVKPGWDVDVLAAVRARFGGLALMADANGAYTLADAGHLAGFDRFDLMMIEQPLAYDDLRDHAALQRRMETSICLDESLHSLRAAADALDIGACRVINVKPGRMGGHAESVRLHDLAAARSVPVWHGGMLESGIGRAHNIHLASLPNFTLPGDIAASRRYFVPDLIDPPVEVGADGTVAVPEGPGIGVIVNHDRVRHATIETCEVKA